MAHVPTKLGPFEPRYRLGAGGMAETFVAVRRGPAGFEQRVCLKRILPAYADDQEFVRAFLAEARTSATLRHANIVQVLDFGRAEGTHYLALELIDGLDLRGLLQRDAELDAELACLIASEIAHALEHAHGEGPVQVVHRDISPSNVLVSRAGEVKLTDFGIARVLGGTHHTASGVIKGKAPYMPPEYVSAGKFDVRSDLFAVGVLLFEVLHKQRPFDGPSELDTLRRIVAGERRPFTAEAPPELVACVERLLEVDPDARFQSARALLDALPPVAVTPARRRLADLVRARTPTLEQALARAASLSLAPTLPAATAATDPDDDPDRVEPPTRPSKHLRRRTKRSRMPSKPALVALGCSLALFTGVVALGLFRLDSRAASAADASRVAQAIATPAPTPPVVTPPSPTRAPSEPVSRPAAEGADAAEARPAKRATASEAHAELRVVAYPFGDVWVDEKHIGASPLSMRLAPGAHVVAVGEGRPRERRTVELHAGERQQVVFGNAPPQREGR